MFSGKRYEKMANYFSFLQRSEQYFTSSQQSAHFLRQVKGRLQVGQIFSGLRAALDSRAGMLLEASCGKRLLWSSGIT